MTQVCLEPFIDLAERLADASGAIVRRYFRTTLEVEDKPDKSPVTVADREAETAIRKLIEEAFPDHGIVGEEYGAVRADAKYVWVLDPIDGTKSFITGKPLFGTLIGLLYEGAAVLGLIDQPVLGERWLGARGRPTTLNGRPVHVRPCGELGRAALYATSPHMFEGADKQAFARVRDAVKLPLYGADCYAYGLLACGFADLVVEASLAAYDYCGVVAVIEGAGGVITDWTGAPLGLGSDGRVVAAGDRRSHERALELLAG
ncbi:MAG: histidinol-phosphatase [Proteobacteria bacterium]|nr:histidinol-phosphatase [Pseudomonadota bacterium]